jgi:glyoxylase-like metal-dependent hydrolase (beta-lactamase superfamily II)
MAFLSRFVSSRGRDLNGRMRELKPNEVPGASGWEWLATPGHSPGHVSLFRPSDRVLLAGDAFATMNLDSWSGLLTGKRTLARGGTPFNTDWEATRLSVKELANLRPNVAGCGHGIPRCDADLPARLERFAKGFRAPRNGRYVRRPARTDESGIISLPPAPFDPVPFATAAALILAGIVLGAGYLDDQRRK